MDTQTPEPSSSYNFTFVFSAFSDPVASSFKVILSFIQCFHSHLSLGLSWLWCLTLMQLCLLNAAFPKALLLACLSYLHPILPAMDRTKVQLSLVLRLVMWFYRFLKQSHRTSGTLGTFQKQDVPIEHCAEREKLVLIIFSNAPRANLLKHAVTYASISKVPTPLRSCFFYCMTKLDIQELS